MQKKLLAVAVLSAFSGVAAAQSANVTLYGTIVQNVENVAATGGDGSVTTTGSSARTGTAGQNGGARVAATTAANGAPGVGDQGGRFRFNPAGSNFGLRGTEDLGNGLSAWFQIELSTNFGSNPPNGASNEGRAPTQRNSGVGLRSTTWGTALFGVWDTPFNTMVNNLNLNSRVSGASTNHSAGLLGGNVFAQGAVSGQATASWCAPPPAVGTLTSLTTTAAGCMNFGMNFDRRERSTMQWWSPNWNGFEVRAAYNTTQDTGSNTVNGQAGGRNALKQSIWDLSLAYSNGPLYVGYAYERQNDTMAAGARTFYAAGGAATAMAGGEVNATATATTGTWTTGTGFLAGTAGNYMSGSSATGHRLGARYTFSGVGPGSLGLGAMWESLQWNMTYAADTGTGGAAVAANLLSGLKKNAWRLQGNYAWGSHFISLDYTRANAMSGNITTVAGGVLGGNAAVAFDGSGTGSRAWMLNYNYMLSKRTSIGAYYNTVRNDTNANYSGIVFGGITTTAPGSSPRYLGMQLRHTF